LFKHNYYQNLNICIGILIIISFFVGFFIQEDSSGGAIDFAHYNHNFKFFYDNNFLNINWFEYESSALPLYYVAAYLFYNPENLFLMKIFSLSLSILSFCIFYQILKKHLKIDKSLTFLLSTTILLSPYFRTGTYWMMEENFPILMSLLTIYFYLNLQNKFNYLNLFITIFFSACAFFSRQNYIIISLGLFLLIFDWKIIFSKKNYLIVLFYLISFSPSIYFIIIWEGLLPPLLVEQERTLIINIYNIPNIMNIILIYLIPFVYLEKKFFFNFINKNKMALIFCFLLYLLVFYNFNPQSFGGGAINKLLFMIMDDLILKYSLIILSFLSFIILVSLFRGNRFILTYFILNIMLFCTITPVWQEYFDPITLIFILLFGNKIVPNIYLNRFIFILVSYLILFLSASIIDQNLKLFY
jgi:hypothetical protein